MPREHSRSPHGSPDCATLHAMSIDERVASLARGILNKTLLPDDIPPYERVAVQALLLVWWLERDVLVRRLPGTTPVKPPSIRTL